MTKLAIVSLHPNNYHDGIWVGLSERKNLDATLLYLSDEGLDKFYDPTFRAERNWNIQIDLSQYDNKFIRNFGRNFWMVPLSRINLGILTEILSGDYDAALIHGYATISAWLAMFAARLKGLRLIFRGEGTLRSNDYRGWRRRLKGLVLRTWFGSV